MSAGPFRRVPVGWDCSAGSAAVLRPVRHGESDEERAAEIAGRRHQAQESFDRARDTLPAPVRAAVSLELAENSDVARTLCEYADTHVFELLVLGRHGTGGVMQPRLGYIAETMAKKSDLPLLLLGGQS